MIAPLQLQADSNSAGVGGAGGWRHAQQLHADGNSADLDAAGRMRTLNNCILYFNSAPNGRTTTSSMELLSAQLLLYNPTPTNGIGNITNAPLFVDTNAWSDSSAIQLSLHQRATMTTSSAAPPTWMETTHPRRQGGHGRV